MLGHCLVVQYFASFLVLRELHVCSSSWCHVAVIQFFATSSRCRGLVCSVWVWHFLVILTYVLGVCDSISIGTVSAISVLRVMLLTYTRVTIRFDPELWRTFPNGFNILRAGKPRNCATKAYLDLLHMMTNNYAFPFFNNTKKYIWASTCNFVTYHIIEQRRQWRVWSHAQTRKNLACSHTQHVAVDQNSEKVKTPRPAWCAKMRFYRKPLVPNL